MPSSALMICLPCRMANRRPGKHRAHQCEGDIFGASAAVVCGCACNAASASAQPPPMVLPD